MVPEQIYACSIQFFDGGDFKKYGARLNFWNCLLFVFSLTELLRFSDKFFMGAF